MPNPTSYTLAIVAFSAALSLLIVSLSAERFARAWRTFRPWPTTSVPPRPQGTPGLDAALASRAPGYGAPPGGICADREAEAVMEGASSALAIRCPYHGTEAGEPCPSESPAPGAARAGGAPFTPKVTTATRALAELEALSESTAPQGPPDPDAPFVGQVRAHHKGDDSPRVEVLEIDPSRPGAAKLRTLPPADMDAETIAATDEARTVWATADQVNICWTIVVSPGDLMHPDCALGEHEEPHSAPAAIAAAAGCGCSCWPSRVPGHPCCACASGQHGNCASGPPRPERSRASLDEDVAKASPAMEGAPS